MPIRLINLTVLLRALAHKHLRVVQKRYESDYEKKGRFGPTYAPVVYVFVNRPPLVTSAAELLVAEGYSKLMQKRHGP